MKHYYKVLIGGAKKRKQAYRSIKNNVRGKDEEVDI
jgi:hypothetical protein